MYKQVTNTFRIHFLKKGKEGSMKFSSKKDPILSKLDEKDETSSTSKVPSR